MLDPELMPLSEFIDYAYDPDGFVAEAWLYGNADLMSEADDYWRFCRLVEMRSPNKTHCRLARIYSNDSQMAKFFPQIKQYPSYRLNDILLFPNLTKIGNFFSSLVYEKGKRPGFLYVNHRIQGRLPSSLCYSVRKALYAKPKVFVQELVEKFVSKVAEVEGDRGVPFFEFRMQDGSDYVLLSIEQTHPFVSQPLALLEPSSLNEIAEIIRLGS
ncbi:MAG: hypothetical protein WBB28_02005 [Crinalium sp.]